MRGSQSSSRPSSWQHSPLSCISCPFCPTLEPVGLQSWKCLLVFAMSKQLSWRCTMRAPGKVTVGEDQSLAFISATVTLFIAAQVSYCFPRDDVIGIQPICVALPTTELVQGRPRNRTMDNESNGLGILQAPRNSLLVERQLSREWLNIWSSLF